MRNNKSSGNCCSSSATSSGNWKLIWVDHLVLIYVLLEDTPKCLAMKQINVF